MAGDFEDFMREMAIGSRGKGLGKSTDIKLIKKYIDMPHLDGLQKGDIIEQVCGIDNETTYATSMDKVVFVRYLTDSERSALVASRENGSGFYDGDCIVCGAVTGTCPQYHTVDSRAFKKAN